MRSAFCGLVAAPLLLPGVSALLIVRLSLSLPPSSLPNHLAISSQRVRRGRGRPR